MRWGIILLVASAATSGATEPDRRALAEKAAQVIAKGLPAGPGAACGKMYLNADRAAAVHDPDGRAQA